MVNFTVLPGSMVIGVTGKRFSISKEDSRYAPILDLIKSKNGAEITDQEMLDLCDPTLHFSEEGVQLKDGVVYIGEEAMPSELSTRIVEMKKEKIPIVRLLKFWENLKLNPSMNSVMQLYKFLEHNGHPLTEDGHFIAYRSIREDWKDFHTGTMDNSIGQVVQMPRNKVNDKSAETCSAGLHVASWEYAVGFGSGGRRLVEVKVNPKDVVCVPDDYNNTKMRVCEFTVLAEVQGPATSSFRREDMDEDDSSHSSQECCDESYDSCDADDEKSYTDEERDQVLDSEREHSFTYSGEGLMSRIAEDTGLDESVIEEILDAKIAY